VRKSSVEIRSK